MLKFNPKHNSWEHEQTADNEPVCRCYVCVNALKQELGWNYSEHSGEKRDTNVNDTR